MRAARESAPALAPAPPRPASDVEQRVAAAITADGMMTDIKFLAAKPHPFRSPEVKANAEWIKAQAIAAGWDAKIVEMPASSRGGILYNVVADKRGSAPDADRKLVIAGAHMDTVTRAPGANDNSSGSAAMLALVKALAPETLANDVRVVWFDGEELGLLGSAAYASTGMKSDISRSIAMLNADMIGSAGGDVGFSMGAKTTSGLGDAIAGVAARNSIKATFRSERHARSDHHSFDRVGIPSAHFGVSVKTVDRDDPHYHSPRDTPDKVDPVKMEAHADLLALTLLDLAGRTARVEGPPPPRGLKPITGHPI
jgi:Iap family predicted aminopeptidase